jgi:hypothetical protein
MQKRPGNNAGTTIVTKPRCTRIAGILAAAAALVCCSSGLEERIEVIIGGQSFRVEVARTAEQKRQGLMHRESLGPREGMIFVYETDQHLSFWMKNTSIPLTLVFLSKDGRILQVEELEPFSLKSVVSERAVRYALELPAGVLEELGVGVGDRVILPEEFP